MKRLYLKALPYCKSQLNDLVKGYQVIGSGCGKYGKLLYEGETVYKKGYTIDVQEEVRFQNLRPIAYSGTIEQDDNKLETRTTAMAVINHTCATRHELQISTALLGPYILIVYLK